MKKRKKIIIVVLATAVFIGLIIGLFLIFQVNQNFITYQNPIHKFSFQYPELQDFEIFEDGGMSGEPGIFGNSLFQKDGYSIFTVDVFYTSEWSSMGNGFGDMDAFEKGFQEGGVEAIAKLAREVNLQKDEINPNKQVGELRSYQFNNGTGYGFTVSDSLDWCFNVNNICGSGRVVDNPLNVVYVTNGKDIYRVEFPVDSPGDKVFSTFRLAE